MPDTVSTKAKGALLVMVTAAVALLLGAALALAQAVTVDRGASDGLTGYLREHKLPLVAAQVSRRGDGSHDIVLYGFVATDLGKSDAERQARQYLNDPNAAIVNRIRVNPEIAHLKAPTGHSPSQSSPAPPPGEEWEDVMQHIYQNGALTPPSSDAGGFPGAP